MNLYLHFPFCRSKCAYCALKSYGGKSSEVRGAYARRLSEEIAELDHPAQEAHTIYLGGGTPALCPLDPIFDALRAKGLLTGDYELTVELHPLDVTAETLDILRAGGVNRVSIGVQTFDDSMLSFLNRRHTAADAIAAIDTLGPLFPSVGMDLIVGLPCPPDLNAIKEVLPALNHVSVYTLIREPNTRLDLDVKKKRAVLPDDAKALAEFASLRALLVSSGFMRYEIANFARPGFECRHNFAVWRGEDYIGLGDGACGRCGNVRTVGEKSASTSEGGNSGSECTFSYSKERLTQEADAVERALFSLRTSDGLDLKRISRLWPILSLRILEWRDILAFHAGKGLLAGDGQTYRLTQRGAEVCDSILEDLI